jgi:hypothetical protein
VGDLLGALFRKETSARKLNLFFGTILAMVAVWMLLT